MIMRSNGYCSWVSASSPLDVTRLLPYRMMKEGNRQSRSHGDSDSGSDRDSDESEEERPKLSKRKRDVSVLDSDDD